MGQIHPPQFYGWLGYGVRKSELPTYNKGRIIHSDDWSNLGPATSGGYHFHRGLLNDAIDFNFHHLTIDRDTFDNNEGEHAYGLHVDFNELPLIEANLFLWQFRADQSNAALAAENGNAIPGPPTGYLQFAFTLRMG